MNTSIKSSTGEKFPSLSWQQTDGTRLAPAEMSGWRMRVVYRGAHCLLCKRYLRTLEELQSAYRDAGIALAVIASDPEDRARAEAADEKCTFLALDQLDNCLSDHIAAGPGCAGKWPTQPGGLEAVCPERPLLADSVSSRMTAARRPGLGLGCCAS